MRVSCQHCGKVFEARRSTARYCTSSCRGKATHRRQAGLDPGAADAEVVQLPTPKAPRAKKRDTPAAKPSRKPTPSPAAAPADENPFLDSYRQQLAAAGKEHSYIGQQAMLLATKLERAIGGETGSSVASLSKELDRLMTVALADVKDDRDELDDINDRVVEMRGRRRRG